MNFDSKKYGLAIVDQVIGDLADSDVDRHLLSVMRAIMVPYCEKIGGSVLNVTERMATEIWRYPCPTTG